MLRLSGCSIKCGGGDPCELDSFYLDLGLLSSKPISQSRAAYREYVTPEQRTQPEHIQTVLVDVITLTDQGEAKGTALAEVVVHAGRRSTPKLEEALKDRDLAKQALVAMGNLGKDGIPLPIDMMNTAPPLEVQAAATKGLGQIGGIAGDAVVVPPLLTKLQDPKTDWAVLTEVAWALGKILDKRSIQPPYDLDKKLQAIRDPDNVSLKKLKEAVFWAIKQCDTWDQYS